MEFLQWLRDTPFCTVIRESDSVWGYPTVLFLHTFGMSILVGLIVVINLRLLGVAGELPAAPLRRLSPLIWTGFWINAITGTILFIIDGPAKVQNPAFPIKLALIALGIVIMRAVDRRVLTPEAESATSVRTGRLLSALSLVVWAGAVTAGRLMAYVGPPK